MKNLNPSLKSELTARNLEFAQNCKVIATKNEQKDKFQGVKFGKKWKRKRTKDREEKEVRKRCTKEVHNRI